MRTYEKFKNGASKNNSGALPKTESAVKPFLNKSLQETRYFNCGAKGHKSDQCPDKSKGAKCFNCAEFGHTANKCPKKYETARNNYHMKRL